MTRHVQRTSTNVDVAASHAHWLWNTLAATSCALILAACASSTKHHGNPSTAHAQAVRYSNCMRSHGVSNFPDRPPGGGFNVRTLGSETGSATFLAAQIACAKTQPSGSGRPAPCTGKQEQQIVAKARCIRTHGVPNLPDPTTVGNGMFALPNLPPSWNPQAPAVIKATKACAHVGMPIPSPNGAVGG